MIFYDSNSRICVELMDVELGGLEWTLVLEYDNKKLYFDYYSCDYVNQVTTRVPESIKQKFKDYMENPFFEIDKRKYMIENNLTEIPEDVEEI